MKRSLASTALFFATALVSRQLLAAELMFPDVRNAYYAKESIELAVNGLDAGQAGKVKITPKAEGATAFEVDVKSDASNFVIPPFSLAPGKYEVSLEGAATIPLTVSTGTINSDLLVSQTIAINDLVAGGSNFILGNSASWGHYPAGQPDLAPRGKKSSGFQIMERAIEMDMPTIIYMYWTGYVTHKPFGSEKSWGNAQEQEAMRMLNFSNAQQLERFAANLHAVGTLDEPGLSWGPTPAGGMASGFPAIDEKDWWEKRGWKWTLDIGNQSDADWMKYMTVRCDIMRESNALAKADLKTVLSDVPFATDLYAPHAIMDGTDPLNQAVNDIPTSHVFVDWGISRFGSYSGLCLEKSDNPVRKIAHATNGQLFSPTVGQPSQTNAYHVTMNAMLMAGLHSNWWLNPTGMTPADLKSVNDPASHIGSLTKQMEVSGHEIAVLWSFTEIAMLQKDVAAREAKKKTGEQIKLMIASMPETEAEGGVPISAYNVGQNYKDQILQTHSAISRAGYASHIIHERVLAEQLKNYKVLVIAAQTFALPADVHKTISDWQQAGGKVITDKQTSVKIENAISVDTKIENWGYKWGDLFGKATQKVSPFKNAKETSLYLTNHYMDGPQRTAAPLIKGALQQAGVVPAVETDSVNLAVERHEAGEGSLIYVLNVNDTLPEIADTDSYPLYTYAPQEATFTLKAVPAGHVVYAIEGINHDKVTKLEKPDAPIAGSFVAGEMKMYLVAPRAPEGITTTGASSDGQLTVDATLGSVKMPWPLLVTVSDPAGKKVFEVRRATDADGKYHEAFAIGSNAPAGAYRVSVTSDIENLKSDATVNVQAGKIQPAMLTEVSRVYRSEQMSAFLKTRPEMVIAVGNDQQQAAARKLADVLSAAGLKVTIKPEADVIRKVNYPRVWNPNATVFKAGSGENAVADMKPEKEITVTTDATGNMTITDAAGAKLEDWIVPNALVTVAGEGLVDARGDQEFCYEAGVKFFINKDGQKTALNAKPEKVEVTDDFKARWAKPWTRLVSHVGGYQLAPQMPEAYTTDSHLILMGDSKTSQAVAGLQASDVLPRIVDATYPGAGKSIITFVLSPFAVEKNVILLGATDEKGLDAAITKLTSLVAQ